MSIHDPVNERDIHQRNIHDLQRQLQEAYVRISALSSEITELKQKIAIKNKRIKDGKGTTSRNNS